jgi:hypothetical protein
MLSLDRDGAVAVYEGYQAMGEERTMSQLSEHYLFTGLSSDSEQTK